LEYHLLNKTNGLQQRPS